ncbi:hypothetical protein FQ154_08510 [Paeniglutamicibacter gangotriensis]|uniref:Subtilisin inhibitor domain-containing protein n=1 Tax=Paeniglutamicibacter gangotriensis TaxID=254787 RepID=A0A5B0EE65_9MICC|nr:hypothetical protein [Paeniglutamicibacter gangotriensis]KAA0977337.1 hypothetical protein FQ154_08510 [Paeniglutamicibacter gangotriensis]
MQRTMTLLFAGLLLGAAALLAGCADDGGSSQSPASPSSTGSSVEAPLTDLQVSIRADGALESAHYRLVCDGDAPLPESQHPNAAKACELVQATPALLTSPKPGVNDACTMQYGGPAVGVVSGTLDGQVVNREFNVRDGCGISDWDAAVPLLVEMPSLQ